MTDFRAIFLSRFRWVGGHADVLGVFLDSEVLTAVGPALWRPFADAGVTKVAAVEARGFVLGTAVALAGGVGFVAVRKSGAVHPGAKATRTSEPDWRGRRHDLVVQRDAIGPGDRVLLVDDWAELGSQARAARELIEECDGGYAGLSLLVDQLESGMRESLEPVAAVFRYEDLPPDA